MPSLATTDEELEAEFQRRKTDSGKDGRICICGHPARCHTSQTNSDNELHGIAREKGEDKCYQTRMACPCSGFYPVIEVNDPRVFRFKTKGNGQAHALSQGIFALRQKQGTVEFLPGWCCRRCGETENLYSVAFNVINGQIKGEAMDGSPYNALVCEGCRGVLAAGGI